MSFYLLLHLTGTKYYFSTYTTYINALPIFCVIMNHDKVHVFFHWQYHLTTFINLQLLHPKRLRTMNSLRFNGISINLPPSIFICNDDQNFHIGSEVIYTSQELHKIYLTRESIVMTSPSYHLTLFLSNHSTYSSVLYTFWTLYYMLRDQFDRIRGNQDHT